MNGMRQNKNYMNIERGWKMPDFKKIIKDLKLVATIIEWDFPLEYNIKIHEIINILEEIEEKLN